ncbi:hypothetical protein CDD82_1398 [Ophiocordyceps australis]|uniref:Mitochondrial glycine transporter n=1 Tax=Ophiocordyceps australis TaxID=1399860 RepID=A0A2C5YJ37_9HYPO|nr:hypothetical protein CDD82_1398 [Ophiocordyceps australis]
MQLNSPCPLQAHIVEAKIGFRPILESHLRHRHQPSILSASSSLGDSLRKLRQSHHVVRALWRGTLPSALRTGFGSALYLSSLNAIRQHAQQTGLDGWYSPTKNRASSSALPSLNSSANLLSGAAARTFAGFVLMPLTVIKVRFESSLYSYTSMWAAAADIWRLTGFGGFFAGFGVTAMRDAPYAGMYVLSYEMLKTRLGSLVPSTPASLNGQQGMQAPMASLVNFSSAVLAGAVCSALSNPFDAIKTRIQLRPQQYKNMWHASYKMVTEDGIRSLWDGLALRMSRKALSSALAWTVYEELIRRSSPA